MYKNIQKGLHPLQKWYIMTQDKIKRIHQIYSWILAALIVAVGILFIFGCLEIYTSGPRPYSAEAIATGFHRICIPVYIAILGIVGGILLNLILPQEPKRTKSPSRPDAVLLRLKKKTGPLEISAKESKYRLIVRIVTAVCYALLMAYPCVYTLTPENFTVSNLNGDILRAVSIIMLPAISGLGLCCLCQKLIHVSLQREINEYKQALASGKKSPYGCQNRTQSSRYLVYIRSSLLLLAVILIVLGILNGGVDDVLKKAIAICTECIGLG